MLPMSFSINEVIAILKQDERRITARRPGRKFEGDVSEGLGRIFTALSYFKTPYEDGSLANATLDLESLGIASEVRCGLVEAIQNETYCAAQKILGKGVDVKRSPTYHMGVDLSALDENQHKDVILDACQRVSDSLDEAVKENASLLNGTTRGSNWPPLPKIS